MSGERLQKWALTAEIIGGIAIVISLIFVGYEVRQSTKEAALNRNALEVSSYQNLMEGIMGLSQPLALDADFAEIYLKATGAMSETLTRLEKLRLTSFLVGYLRHGSMAFFQYQRGVIDQEQLDSVLSYVGVPIVTIPWCREMWDTIKYGAFTEDYVEYMDAMILEREQRRQSGGRRNDK
jgi:hypothetical protein